MRRAVPLTMIGLLVLASGCSLLDRIAETEPTVSIAAQPTSGGTPLVVRFDAMASHAEHVMQYLWRFGDEAAEISTTEPTVEHIYTQPGIFTACLTVIDVSNNVTSSAELVIETSNRPPIAACRLSNDAPVRNERVQFDASGSIDFDGRIVDYTWDFGDGSSMRGPRVSHVYEEIGLYTVRLTIEDNAGAVSSVTHTVDVHRGSAGGGCGSISLL